MKKYLNVILTIVIAAVVSVTAFFIANASSNKDVETSKTEVKTQPIKPDFSVDPVKMIAMDKEAMFIIAKDSCAESDSVQTEVFYFETQVMLSGEVDTTPDAKPVKVVNVFQMNVNNLATGTSNPTIYQFEHKANGQSVLRILDNTFMVGNVIMNNEKIEVTLSNALETLSKVDFKKPHSKFVTLRRELGPQLANAQWIFGNIYTGMLYVDASTGSVTDKNPVYPQK